MISSCLLHHMFVYHVALLSRSPSPPPFSYPISTPSLCGVKCESGRTNGLYVHSELYSTYVCVHIVILDAPPPMPLFSPLPSPLLQGAAAGCKLLLCGRPAVDSKVLLQRSALLELVRQGEGEGGY